jgi:hypothetical protein
MYINSENGTGITKPKWFVKHNPNKFEISVINLFCKIHTHTHTHIRELNSFINVCYRPDGYSKE